MNNQRGVTPSTEPGGFQMKTLTVAALLFSVAVSSLLSVNIARAQGPATSVHAGPITAVTVVRGAPCNDSCEPSILTNNDELFPELAVDDVRPFRDVPNAFATMRIDKPTLFMARFFADASCRSSFLHPGSVVANDGFCAVKILVAREGGEFVEMDPTTWASEIFQANRGTGASAIERSFIAEERGLYTVKVQFSMPFGFDPRHPEN